MPRNSKSTYIVILIAVLAIALAVGVALYITGRGPGGGADGNTFDLGEGGRSVGGGQTGGSGEEGGGTRPPPPSTGASGTQTIPALRKISSSPVAGLVSFTRDSTPIIRYVERGTGHVYEARADRLETERLSNTTVKAVAEALWAPGGESLLMRYAREDSEEIETVFAKLVKGSAAAATSTRSTPSGEIIQAPYDLSLQFLERNILFPVILPAKEEFFYFLSRDDGAHGYRARLDGTKKTEVFTSPLREWLAGWPTEKNLLLSAKPSGTSAGSAYLYELSTKTMRKIAGGLGLTVLVNPTLEYALVGEVVGSRPTMSSLTLKSGEKLDLGLNTLPEKCLWSRKTKGLAYCAVPETLPQAIYPDAWYQGRISFNDMIWKIQLPEGTGETVDLPAPAGTTFDMIDLALDPTESYLYFRNKTDGSLWSLQLQERPMATTTKK